MSAPQRQLSSPHEPQSTAGAVLLACLVLLPLLGHRVLAAWDEGIYAEIAREMLVGGTLHAWLVPHWNGHLWFEKPPLQMWLTACSLRLFGINAFAARLPSALAGIACVGVLHAWLFRRFNLLSAWFSTVILLSAFGFQHVARAGETDTLLSFFTLLAVIGLAEVLQHNSPGWPLFFAGFGLALMTKGAASLPLLLTAIVVAARARRQVRRDPRPFVAGVLLFLFIAVPWHAYAYTQFGQSFLQPYLGFHVLQRATSAIEGHTTHPWFYLWVLLISAPLFSLFFPFALLASFRRNELAPLLPFAVFALLEFIFFSAIRTRLPHYIAPLYPPLAAITGTWLATRLTPRAPNLRHGPAKLALAAVSAYVLLALLTSAPRKALHAPVLGPGLTNPDNRESAGLLQRLQSAKQSLPAGPLLVWQAGPVIPITTDAFYARRTAQQVSLAGPPSGVTPSIYFNDPASLTDAVPAPRLLLLDSVLLPQLSEKFSYKPLLTGPSQTVAIVTPKP